MRAYDKCIHFIHIKEGRIMERRTPWLGYLCVILSAVIFGCMPLGANFLYAQGVTPMSLVFLRNLLSLPVLALLCQKQGGLRISRRCRYGTLLGSCAPRHQGERPEYGC